MKKYLSGYSNQLLLALILIIAVILRFYHLDFQSFWSDEMATVDGASPHISWKDSYTFITTKDLQPPLMYFVEKIAFLLFGWNEFVARAVPALAGSISVWAIYVLGKELYSKRLGLIAAAITSFNIFSINYSQDTRPYALLMLFSILAFTYLIRFIKYTKRKDSIKYGIFAVLMFFTHYYGFFLLASQIVIGTIFWQYADDKKKYFFNYALAGVVIAIGFVCMLPFIKALPALNVFWIPPIPAEFASNFFFEYFGTDLLKPFLSLMLLSCFLHMFIAFRKEQGNLKERPLTFVFTICAIWIFVGLFIPYLRSVLSVPLLITRYTIGILPAYIILLSLGLELIASNMAKSLLFIFFAMLSFTNIFCIKKYYTTVSKTQFRELVKFISEDNELRYPIISDIPWEYQEYYYAQVKPKLKVIKGREDIIDSILNKSDPKFDLDGFWITGACYEPKLPEATIRRLESSYTLIKGCNLFDAWARLYMKTNINNKKITVIDYRSFPSQYSFATEKEKLIVMWDKKEAISNPILFKKGDYKIVMNAYGTPVKGIYPHLLLTVNGKLTGEYYTKSNSNGKAFKFNIPADTAVTIKIAFDNDAADSRRGEDRNLFIKSMVLLPL